MKLQILDDTADSDTSDGENVDNASIDSDPDGSFEAGIACAQDMITDALSQMRRTRTVPHRDALVAMAIMHQDFAYAIRPKRSPARGLWPPGGRALIDDATNAADNE